MVGEAGGCSKATRREDLQHGINAAYVTAVSAASVGLTSAGGWLEIAGREGRPDKPALS
jgi:hypothetical protein